MARDISWDRQGKNIMPSLQLRRHKNPETNANLIKASFQPSLKTLTQRQSILPRTSRLEQPEHHHKGTLESVAP